MIDGRDTLAIMPTGSSRIGTSGDVHCAIAPLVDRGLMIRDGDAFLSLAIALGEYSPSETILERFEQLIETIDSATRELVVL